MGSGTSSTATVIELRSYPMKPLSRDSFIDNFEAHYLEEIERFGALVLGQFRVIDDPDCFVWLRGYSEMNRREPSLRGFYAGEVWKRHGEISMALFLRPLTVRLLRPLAGTDLTAGATLASTLSAFASGTCSVETGVIVIDTLRVTDSAGRDELGEVLRNVTHVNDSELRGLLVAEERADGWEEDAIRDVHELIMVTAHRGTEAAARHTETLAGLVGQSGVELSEKPTSRRLLPTMRSPLRYR
jgi:hypothetical protein